MEALHIEATSDTPAIDFEATSGILRVSGKSYPQNVFQFYQPASQWIRDFLATGPEKAELHLEFQALNSSTTKVVFDWLDLWEQRHEDAPDSVKIIWHYPPERAALEQAGEDFREAFEDLPFELIDDLI